MEDQKSSTFIGVEVTSERISWVEAQDEESAIRLTNACLVKTLKKKSGRVCLEIHSPDSDSGATSTCAVLSTTGAETQRLSVLSPMKIGLKLSGPGAKGAIVHVVGYTVEPEQDDDSSWGGSDGEELEMEDMELDFPDAVSAMLSAAVGVSSSDEEEGGEDEDQSDGDTAADNIAALNRAKNKAGAADSATEKAVVAKRHPSSSQFKTHKSGLKFQDLLVGAGKPVKNGHNVAVEYVLRLENGKVVDKTRKKQPFKFRLGIGECIKGFDIGIAGMREGGSRHLVVPSDIGYGKQGAPPDIPPHATLFFDVKVVKVW